MKKNIIFILASLIFSFPAFAKKKDNPFSGSISVSYQKGFDLFSTGSISTGLSLGYGFNERTEMSVSYSYKNDPKVSASRMLFLDKKRKMNLISEISFQVPVTKKSKDNKLITGVNGALIGNMTLGPSRLTLVQNFGYNIYSSEVDSVEGKGNFTNFSTTTNASVSLPVIKKLSLGASAALINVWDLEGDRTNIQSYSAGLSYDIHKQLTLSANFATSSKTISFDTLFDDETSSYSVGMTMNF